MFYGCKSLTNINLSNFNTKNVQDMKGMFYGCKSLTNINSNDTKLLEQFKQVHQNCSIF